MVQVGELLGAWRGRGSAQHVRAGGMERRQWAAAAGGHERRARENLTSRWQVSVAWATCGRLICMYSETLKVLRIAGRETWEAREARAAEQSHGPFGQDRQEDTGGRGRSAGETRARTRTPAPLPSVWSRSMTWTGLTRRRRWALRARRHGRARDVLCACWRVVEAETGEGRRGAGGSGRGRPDDHAADTRADGRLWCASE